MLAMPGAGRIVTSTYLDRQWINGIAGSFSFTGLSFGAAKSDRCLVACTGWVDQTVGNALSSLTIGGVSASILGQAGTNLQSSIAIAAVPTGTSGNVDLVFTGTAQRACVYLYLVDGLLSAVADSFSTSTAASPTATLNIPEYSTAIGVVMAQGSPVILNGWTGLTQRDWTNGATSYDHTTASANFTAANPSLSVTASFSSLGTAGAAGCFAVFAP